MYSLPWSLSVFLHFAHIFCPDTFLLKLKTAVSLYMTVNTFWPVSGCNQISVKNHAGSWNLETCKPSQIFNRLFLSILTLQLCSLQLFYVDRQNKKCEYLIITMLTVFVFFCDERKYLRPYTCIYVLRNQKVFAVIVPKRNK